MRNLSIILVILIAVTAVPTLWADELVMTREELGDLVAPSLIKVVARSSGTASIPIIRFDTQANSFEAVDGRSPVVAQFDEYFSGTSIDSPAAFAAAK